MQYNYLWKPLWFSLNEYGLLCQGVKVRGKLCQNFKGVKHSVHWFYKEIYYKLPWSSFPVTQSFDSIPDSFFKRHTTSKHNKYIILVVYKLRVTHKAGCYSYLLWLALKTTACASSIRVDGPVVCWFTWWSVRWVERTAVGFFVRSRTPSIWEDVYITGFVVSQRSSSWRTIWLGFKVDSLQPAVNSPVPPLVTFCIEKQEMKTSQNKDASTSTATRGCALH